TCPGKDVAVPRVESDFSLWGVGCDECCPHVTFRFLYNASHRIDRRGNAVVGGQQNPAVVLDRSHSRHCQMLKWSPGFAIPGVVRDVDQDLRPISRKLSDFIGEDRLVADEDSSFHSIQIESAPFGAAGKVADFARELAGKE